MTEVGLFDKLLATQASRKYPPIDKWHPTMIGRSDMHIEADGSWYYDKSPIRRVEMVKVFASILRREDDGYYLVMPHEKLSIEVEDVPFQIVDFCLQGANQDQTIVMTTNLDDHVVVSRANPLTTELYRGDLVPYLLVRGALKARLNRNTYYRLAEILTFQSNRRKSPPGIWSKGAFFPLQ